MNRIYWAEISIKSTEEYNPIKERVKVYFDRWIDGQLSFLSFLLFFLMSR